MIKKFFLSEARGILVVYCTRKEGRRIRSITDELMRQHSTIRDWFVWTMRHGLGGRFDLHRLKSLL